MENNNDNKKSMLQQLADKLVDWDKQIDDLKKKAAASASDVKQDINKMVEELEKKSKEVEVKIDEIKKSSGEGWQEIKIGLDKAANEISGALSRAYSKFKK